MSSFHITELPVDPIDENPNAVRVYRAGDVMRDKGAYPFSDYVILGFTVTGLAKVARPYAYVSCVGTTGPTLLTGAEVMEVNVAWLRNATRVGEGRTT